MENQHLSLTVEEQKQAVLAAKVALARERLLPYAQLVNPQYSVVPHIKAIADVLEAVERGDERRVLIIAPPRAGKSNLTSGLFPSWCLGRDQTRSFIGTSYGGDLAEKFSVMNRDTIAENEYFRLVFPKCYINPKRSGKNLWALAGQDETYKAAGITGGITGFGAWCLLIDDPVKDYQQAISNAYRQAAWDWYLATSSTRLAPNGRIIIIQTRWHEDDLTGRILNSREAEDYYVLHIPELSYGCEQDYRYDDPPEEVYQQRIEAIPKTAFPDPLGRPKGQALQVGRGRAYSRVFNQQVMELTQLIMDHRFEALFQGNPGAPAGQKFKREWFRLLTRNTLKKLPLTKLAQARSYDLAWSEKTSADYTVGLRATLYKVNVAKMEEITDEELLRVFAYGPLPPVMLVIEDIERWQLEWDDSADKIAALGVTDSTRYDIIMEAVAVQHVAIRKVRQTRALKGHTIISTVPVGDKEERAKYSLSLGKLGVFFILCNDVTDLPPWRKDFLDELGLFPNGANDDQVDALTQMVNKWETHIQEVLMASEGIVTAQWKTPFMKKQRTGLHNKLPPEFVPDNPFGKQVGRMGWRQR